MSRSGQLGHGKVKVTRDKLGQCLVSKAIGGLKELLSSVCDHCHDRCVKVMTARAKVGQGHKRQTRPVPLLQGHRRF